MECRTARLLLPYLQTPGELPVEDAQAIEQHLAVCAACRGRVESDRKFDRAIARAMGDVAIPAGLRDDIRIRLAQENARVWRRGLARASAIAAGLLLVASIAFGWWQSRIVFSPEQFVQEQDQQVFLEFNRSLESAEEYFRSHNVRTELPRDFDYNLLQMLAIVEMKGKPVARLDFARGDARARVFVLPKRDFRLQKDTPFEVMGSRCTLEVIDASPDFLFVIIYTGGGDHQMFMFRAIVG